MLTDDQLAEGFEQGALAQFAHADHVRLSLVYLTRYGRDEALRRLGDGLLLFATLKGHPEKFHVTMTRAWVDLLESARATCADGASPAAIMEACPELLDKGALRAFYSSERLDSEEARTGWMPPDLAPAVTFAGLRASQPGSV